MKTMRLLPGLLLPLAFAACDVQTHKLEIPEEGGIFSLSDVAKILSDLPLQGEQLAEVHDAVSASSLNGYDEEYRLTDLIAAPGSSSFTLTT